MAIRRGFMHRPSSSDDSSDDPIDLNDDAGDGTGFTPDKATTEKAPDSDPEGVRRTRLNIPAVSDKIEPSTDEAARADEPQAPRSSPRRLVALPRPDEVTVPNLQVLPPGAVAPLPPPPEPPAALSPPSVPPAPLSPRAQLQSNPDVTPPVHMTPAGSFPAPSRVPNVSVVPAAPSTAPHGTPTALGSPPPSPRSSTPPPRLSLPGSFSRSTPPPAPSVRPFAPMHFESMKQLIAWFLRPNLTEEELARTSTEGVHYVLDGSLDEFLKIEKDMSPASGPTTQGRFANARNMVVHELCCRTPEGSKRVEWLTSSLTTEDLQMIASWMPEKGSAVTGTTERLYNLLFWKAQAQKLLPGRIRIEEDVDVDDKATTTPRPVPAFEPPPAAAAPTTERKRRFVRGIWTLGVPLVLWLVRRKTVQRLWKLAGNRTFQVVAVLGLVLGIATMKLFVPFLQEQRVKKTVAPVATATAEAALDQRAVNGSKMLAECGYREEVDCRAVVSERDRIRTDMSINCSKLVPTSDPQDPSLKAYDFCDCTCKK